MDWSGILANESSEEEEMSMLATGFAAQMLKQIVDLEDKLASTSDGKRLRRSSLDEEAQKEWAIIAVDSPDQATNDQPVLEGALSGVDAPLEEGIPTGGTNVDEMGEGSLSRLATAPLPLPKPIDTVSSRRRPPD